MQTSSNNKLLFEKGSQIRNGNRNNCSRAIQQLEFRLFIIDICTQLWCGV